MEMERGKTQARIFKGVSGETICFIVLLLGLGLWEIG